jgi:phasin family protein
MSDKPGFPGADAMTKAAEQMRHNAEEFSRMFGEMKFPGIPNADAVLAAHKRNIEALTKANKVAFEGAQTVAKRNIEIAQQTLAELTESLRALVSGEPPKDRAAQQAELLKLAYERAMAHTREISQLVQTTNSEALAVLNTRFTEAVEEVKTLIAKAHETPPPG